MDADKSAREELRRLAVIILAIPLAMVLLGAPIALLVRLPVEPAQHLF